MQKQYGDTNMIFEIPLYKDKKDIQSSDTQRSSALKNESSRLKTLYSDTNNKYNKLNDNTTSKNIDYANEKLYRDEYSNREFNKNTDYRKHSLASPNIPTNKQYISQNIDQRKAVSSYEYSKTKYDSILSDKNQDYNKYLINAQSKPINKFQEKLKTRDQVFNNYDAFNSKSNTEISKKYLDDNAQDYLRDNNAKYGGNNIDELEFTSKNEHTDKDNSSKYYNNYDSLNFKKDYENSNKNIKMAKENLLNDDIFIGKSSNIKRNSRSSDRINKSHEIGSKSVSWNKELEQYNKNPQEKDKEDLATQEMLACVTNSTNNLVEIVLKKIGFKFFNNEGSLENFKIANQSNHYIELYWDDKFFSLEKFLKIKKNQITNHILGISSISNKIEFIKNIFKLQAYTSEYNFVPMSWILPEQLSTFQTFCKNKFKTVEKSKEKLFIQKHISKNKITKFQLFTSVDYYEELSISIIQEFIKNQLLINKKNFSLRLFVLILNIDPLLIYLHQLGIVYISRNTFDPDYLKSLDETKNKESPLFCSTENLQYFLEAKKIDFHKIWNQMQNLIIKSIFVAHPCVISCLDLIKTQFFVFEILAFDFIVNDKFNPYLIGITQSPSMKSGNDFEKDLKAKILHDSFALVIRHHYKNNSSTSTTNISEKRDKTNKDTIKTDEMFYDNNLKIRIISEARNEYLDKAHSGYKKIFPMKDENELNAYLVILNLCHQHLAKENSLLENIKSKIVNKKQKEYLLNSNLSSKNNLVQVSDISLAAILLKLNKIHISIPKLSTEKIVQNYLENWNNYKTDISNYWFIELNIEKRRKIIDLVKMRVNEVLTSVLSVDNLDNYTLTHTFQKLYNRLMDRRGDGLFECFNKHGEEVGWRVMFSKSSTKLSEVELQCCQTIVDLCSKALLLAYHSICK